MSSSDIKKQLQAISSMKSITAPHVALGDWEEVYSVQPVTQNLFGDVDGIIIMFQEDTTYYKTSGGGPEGGYFVKMIEDYNGLKLYWVYKVFRNWVNPWRYERIPDAVLEYEPADEMAGKTARCRVIEVYTLRDSGEVSKRHRLWGNAIEIVKALRDGYASRNSEYQHICLGVILHHFEYLDRYLDLVPAENCPSYKKVLQDLQRKQQEEDSEDSGSDSE